MNLEGDQFCALCAGIFVSHEGPDPPHEADPELWLKEVRLGK